MCQWDRSNWHNFVSKGNRIKKEVCLIKKYKEESKIIRNRKTKVKKL